MQYSAKHIEALNRWREVGSEELTEAEVRAIEAEDREMGAHVPGRRSKAAEARAATLRKQAVLPASAPAQRPASKWVWDKSDNFDQMIEKNKKESSECRASRRHVEVRVFVLGRHE